MNFKNSCRAVFLIFVTLLINSNLYAATSPIGLGAFSGSETVIDFNSIADEELITTQYTGSGVTFSGAIYGMTNEGDLSLFPGNGGGVIASNWLYDGGGLQGLSFTATFSASQTRVGFYVETNDPDNTTIEVRLDGGLQGSEQFDTANTATFIGVEEPDGFDSMTVTVQNNDNGFLAIDDLRFEGEPSAASIPTLSEWGMIIFMLLLSGVAFFYLRRSKTFA